MVNAGCPIWRTEPAISQSMLHLRLDHRTRAALPIPDALRVVSLRFTPLTLMMSMSPTFTPFGSI